MKRMLLILSVITLIVLSLSSCNDQKAGNQSQYEAWNSGEITIYYDNQLSFVLDSVFNMYRKTFPDIKPTFIAATSRECVRMYLNSKSKVIVLARPFLQDEDSIITAMGFNFPIPYDIAQDALVYFTHSASPIDTLNANLLENYFTDNKMSKTQVFGAFPEPEFVICEPNSSVFANFKTMVLKDKFTNRKLTIFSTIDSVKQYVLNNKNAIGIGYLGHIVGDINYKAIKLGYLDSTGKHHRPRTVHQAYIVQSLYPYIVTYQAHILSEEKNLAKWFAQFISKESSVQKYFKDYGLVPAFAKIVLIQDE
jgi:ABC-type phosphate transport system substrate-binding protein